MPRLQACFVLLLTVNCPLHYCYYGNPFLKGEKSLISCHFCCRNEHSSNLAGKSILHAGEAVFSDGPAVEFLALKSQGDHAYTSQKGK